MEIKEILKTVDHTLLLPASTWSEIKEILDDAMKYETASACIPASFVKRASEIDMVINIGDVKDGRFDVVEDEIRQIHEACNGHILKVIIETALLTEEEIIKMCEVVTKAGAEFIKTSTGFSTAGATFEHVALMKKHVGEGVLVKAAGGISSIEDAEKFIGLGASRLGTSRIVKIVKNQSVEEGTY